MTQFLNRNSPIPAYMAYPRFLLTTDLNETAALVYTVFLDRARISMQTEGWQDKEGQLPSVKLGNRYRVKTEDFYKWWDKQAQQTQKNILKGCLPKS